jgi:hypothetical protein
MSASVPAIATGDAVKVTRLLLLIAVAHGAVVSSASASIPVFEAYAGPRPRQADVVMPFFAELGKLSPGFLTNARTIQGNLGLHLPLPGSDPSITTAEFAKQLDLADAAWIRQPALEELLTTLTSAVEAAKSNPAFLVTDPSRRETFRRVLLAYAITLARSGDTRASESAMAEWIRTFPDQVVTRSHDGSDAEQLYGDTRKVLSRLGRGTLTVNVDLTLKVYVNEVIRRSGVATGDLLPGRYRVLVLDRYNKSRRYTVDVLANQDSVLSIDWAVDSALKLTPAYAAFEFSTTAELAQAGQAVGRFVESALGAPGVVLIKVTKSEHGPMMVTAELYSAKRATAIRGASAELRENARDNTERVVALAHFVALRQNSPSITVNVLDRDPVEPPAQPIPPASKPAPPTVSENPPADSVNSPADDVASAAPRKGLLSSHPHLFQTLLIGGGVAMGAWGVYKQVTATSVVDGPSGPVTVNGGTSKVGLIVGALGALPLTIGVCWIIDEHYPARTGGSRPKSNADSAALALVPVYGGGAVTLTGRF